MFADVADKPPRGRLRSACGYRLRACGGTFASSPTRKIVRGLRLNMANTPKKVKDPTEVALSAIQEALNISEQSAANRSPAHEDVTPPSLPPAVPDFSASSCESRPNTDRPVFEPIEEPRSPRRAANDDRETIGQLLQALQKGRPARNVYTLASLSSGAWLLGCIVLTFAFLPSLQAAMAQGTGVL